MIELVTEPAHVSVELRNAAAQMLCHPSRVVHGLTLCTIRVPGHSDVPTMVRPAIDVTGRQALLIDVPGAGTAAENAAEQLQRVLDRHLGDPVRMLIRRYDAQTRCSASFEVVRHDRRCGAGQLVPLEGDPFAVRAWAALSVDPALKTTL